MLQDNGLIMLTCQKDAFFIPDNVTYLNCAYMSPSLRSVDEAGLKGLHQKRLPFEVSVADFFEPMEVLREEFARLIEAPEAKRIVAIPSVSYGLSVAAKNIFTRKGDKIILISEQFPSNVYTWRRLAQDTGAEIITIDAPNAKAGRGKLWNEQLLEAIDEQTKVVAMPHVHWADGTVYDLKSVRERTREVGAKLIIDGTQSVGAYPFSIEDFDVDALICGGYKWLLGPYSMGLAYFGQSFDEGTPLEENWINRIDSDNFKGLVNYKDEYLPFAMRYEVGEHSNFILLPMLLEAIKQLNSWKPENIQAYCQNLVSPFIKSFREMGFFVEEPEYRANHLLGVHVPSDFDFDLFNEKLRDSRIFVSARGTSVRISPHLYNTSEDMQNLLDCFQEMMQTS